VGLSTGTPGLFRRAVGVTGAIYASMVCTCGQNFCCGQYVVNDAFRFLQRGCKKRYRASICTEVRGQTQKTGLFQPQFGKEQAHLIYRENASFHELLREYKRKSGILRFPILV